MKKKPTYRIAFIISAVLSIVNLGILITGIVTNNMDIVTDPSWWIYAGLFMICALCSFLKSIGY